MEEGNIYWASFRAAIYAAITLFLAVKTNGCITEYRVESHNCAVESDRTIKDFTAKYQTNIVVRTIKTSSNYSYDDWNGTKLLLYEEAKMKYGPENFILEMKEFHPCQKHTRHAPRIYYSVRKKD